MKLKQTNEDKKKMQSHCKRIILMYDIMKNGFAHSALHSLQTQHVRWTHEFVSINHMMDFYWLYEKFTNNRKKRTDFSRFQI